MKSRTSIVAGSLSVFVLSVLLGACVPEDPMTGAGTGGRSGTGGSGSGTGGSGAGTGGAPATCTPGDSSGLANFAGMTIIVQDYCGGAGCHNELQPPKLFEGDLYTVLTTYRVAKCGNRLLVDPCKPESSAFLLVQKGECEMVEKMPKGCVDRCTVPEDWEAIRKWIANGAPK